MSKIYGQRTDYPVEKLADSVYRINEFHCANMYLFVGTERALLVDTGTGMGNIKDTVRQITNLPLDVVITHAHCDHTGGSSHFDEIYVHEDDFCFGNKLQSTLFCRKIFYIVQSMNELTKKYNTSIKDVRFGGHKTKWIPIKDGKEFDLGNKVIKVKHTPGHTQGSITLIDEKDKVCIIGDNISTNNLICLPHNTTVEEWFQTALYLKDMSKEYKLYFGHMDGKITDELIDLAISYATEVMKKKNSLFHGMKGYPKIDFMGSCFMYNPKKIHKKN